MSTYKRFHEPGAMLFVTCVTQHRQPILGSDDARACLRQAIEQTRQRLPFDVEAWVLLPDHWHALWQLPAGDSDCSGRVSQIKSLFTRRWLALDGMEETMGAGYADKGYRGVWQPRFYEHTIRDATDFENHAAYIHFNPVKHGLVKRPVDWPWSTMHRWVKEKRLPANWGVGAVPCGVEGMDGLE